MMVELRLFIQPKEEGGYVPPVTEVVSAAGDALRYLNRGLDDPGWMIRNVSLLEASAS